MPYREKRIYSGAMLEIERRHCTHTGQVIGKRGRGLRTSPGQEKINLANARRRLMRLLCENFRRGDLYITLTYERITSAEERAADLARFLRRLRRLCRERVGKELRYICVKEDRQVRPHYHLVCQSLPITPAQLLELWGQGRVELGTLDGNPDYGWLARYLTKQAEKERGKKRWSQSKNLRPPYEPEPRILKRKALARRPQVPKGYFVLASYRYATTYGYEGEYVVAIREDRKQELPLDIRQQMEESETWGQMAGIKGE